MNLGGPRAQRNWRVGTRRECWSISSRLGHQCRCSQTSATSPCPSPSLSLPPMPAEFDLKQVGQLFNDAVAAIRDDMDVDSLEPQAIAWLKTARYNLMRNVEKEYYKLERSRNNPMSQELWALDPTQYLYLFLEPPAILEPYRGALLANLETLLKDCGFKVLCSSRECHLVFRLYFPAQLTAAPSQARKMLYIQDEFSQPPTGEGGEKQNSAGTFSAGNFARLLIGARAGASGDGDSGDNTEASPSVKEEGDKDQTVEKGDAGEPQATPTGTCEEPSSDSAA
ncbi:hypothetical protein K438DRAFT_2029652 [Mycena galopus ATCC 62051]|nr:hypothetical protein K438DRAFT_2029652 [Mycena galopus ATCC 62051]